MKLTPEQIEETGEAVKAWLRGEPTQFFSTGTETWCNPGPSAQGLVLSVRSESVFRRAPQPKLRAWKPEEVPFNAAFRAGEAGYPTNWIDINGDGIVLGIGGKGYPVSFEKLKGWQHSIDGGKTWHQCGVMESNS